MAHLIPRFGDQEYSADTVSGRRRWIEERTGADLSQAGALSFPAEEMRGNVENAIGVAQVPLGVAGPLLVKGEEADGIFYVPMATTEGAMVRSYERGALALTRAGGAVVRLFVDENRLAPLFIFPGIAEAAEFVRELPKHFEALRAEAETTTRHGRLLRIEPHPIGRQVMVHFCYSTGDASGMNMVAKATDRACRWLVEKGIAPDFYLFSAIDSEKHASSSLFLGGKGKQLVAGARVPAQLVRSYLGTTPGRMMEFWESNVLGQFHSGSTTCNAHYANGLAAVFIACGQDVANVANSAVGITRIEVLEGGDLYATVTLPSITVATVGGGTHLGTARGCLEMLGCLGAGKARRFAEILAALLLAGEVSLLAAISAGELVGAHEAYGRNRPSALARS